MEKLPMLIPVEVSSFAVEAQRGLPLVVLKETGGERTIAIPIDPVEACAIAMHSLQVRTEKPFTIDLVKIAIDQLGGALYRVVISDFEDGAFSASIVVRGAGGSALKVIDCRPCDAVALAMRSTAPMFVRDAVFAKSGFGPGAGGGDDLRARVRSIDTVEFGSFVLD